MKRKIAAAALALMLLPSLAACASGEAADPGAEDGLYQTVVHYSGEDESWERYLQIARRSAELLPLLEEEAGAFVVDAYNFQAIDEEGTPLYTQNTLRYPEEIAPNGRSLRVSKNYFSINPIETADGVPVTESLDWDDRTLNLLVPEKYRPLEEQITAAYREQFYFEKVTAENVYNEQAGESARLEIAEDDLTVHIIYVKDGQKYNVLRADCAQGTGGWVEDPVVQIYTGNIHCNYAHSFLSQWLYFPCAGDAGQAYEMIRPYIEQCGAEESVQRVEKV